MKKIMIFIVAFLSGCASVGNDFQYNRNDSYGRDTLEIGTPSSKYASMFGEPSYTEKKDTSNGTFRLARYQYTIANLASANSRLLDLEFRNEILNGYIYISSFDEDKTVLPSGQLSIVKRGISTDNDAFKALGKPHGISLCPSEHPDFKEKCGKESKISKIWKWIIIDKVSTFGSAYAAEQPKINTVTIMFDKNNIVDDIQSSSSN